MRMLKALALTLIVANLAGAQTAPDITWPLDSGTKIRIRAASLGASFRRGTLTRTTPDSITIEPLRAGAFSVGLDQVSSVQVLTESHTAKAKYTMIGLLIGAGTGAILGAATYSPAKCDASVTFCVDVFDRGATTAVAAVALGAVGALVGLMAGASPKETWVPVSVPAR